MALNRRQLMTGAAALGAATLLPAQQAQASSCGCGSAKVLLASLDSVRSVAPELTSLPEWRQVELLQLNLDYLYPALVSGTSGQTPYAEMNDSERQQAYAEMVELSASFSTALDDLAAACAQAGAPAQAVDILRSAAAGYREPTSSRVGNILAAPKLAQDERVSEDAVLQLATAELQDTADRIAGGDINRAVQLGAAASERGHPQHFAHFAEVAGPASLLASRMVHLREGGLAIAPQAKRADLWDRSSEEGDRA